MHIIRISRNKTYYTFSFLRLPERMVLDPNWPYKGNSKGSVLHPQSTLASIEAWNILTWPDFLFWKLFYWTSQATLWYVWKKYPKSERHLHLVAHIFTKISQIMCLNKKMDKKVNLYNYLWLRQSSFTIEFRKWTKWSLSTESFMFYLIYSYVWLGFWFLWKKNNIYLVWILNKRPFVFVKEKKQKFLGISLK